MMTMTTTVIINTGTFNFPDLLMVMEGSQKLIINKEQNNTKLKFSTQQMLTYNSILRSRGLDIHKRRILKKLHTWQIYVNL